MPDVTIRSERRTDRQAIRHLIQAAFTERFGSAHKELALVDRLRASSDLEPLLLVAERDGDVLGHAVFSRVWLADHPDVTASVLGPLAVRPDAQRQGIGTALMEAGLDALRQRGMQLVFATGDPNYYDRFGFVSLAPHGLFTPFRTEYDLVLDLRGGTLDTVGGEVEYPALWLQVLEMENGS